MPYLKYEYHQKAALNLQNHPVVPNSQPVIRRPNQFCHITERILLQFRNLTENSFRKWAVQFSELLCRRFGPDYLKTHQNPFPEIQF